jgi:hypothetical protein
MVALGVVRSVASAVFRFAFFIPGMGQDRPASSIVQPVPGLSARSRSPGSIADPDTKYVRHGVGTLSFLDRAEPAR